MPTRTVTLVASLVALGAGLAALAGLPGRATVNARTTADEPQYLLTATSLAADADLDIANQLADQAHLPYHEVPIDPQTFPLDSTGRQVSPHDPLLPLILALPMGLGGWVAAKATLVVLGAFTAGLTWWTAIRRFEVSPRTGAVVVLGAFAGVPLAPYGSQVYPEMAAALALVAVVAALHPSPRPEGQAVLRPGAITVALVSIIALPWLAVKYVPVAAAAGLVLVGRLRARPAGAGLVVLVAAVAGVVYLGAHQWIYGGWTAYASGDHFVASGELGVVGTEVDLVGRSRRLVGLLVDRRFGLAAWSPIWLTLPVAAGFGLGGPRPGAPHRIDVRPLVALVVLVAVVWATATFVALTMHGWWVPGRQVVVALPVAAIVVAVWADGSARRVWVLVGLGLIGALNWAWLAVEAATGRRTLVVDFDQTSAPAFRAVGPLLPDGIRAAPADTVLLGVWTLIVVAALGWGWAGGRRIRSHQPDQSRAVASPR